MSADVEERVRRALAARAGQITAERLQPSAPPTSAPARRGFRLAGWRSLLVAAVVVAAAVLVMRWPGTTPSPLPVPNPPTADLDRPVGPPAGPATGPAPTGLGAAEPTADPVPATPAPGR
jgi:hypothetical protein